MTTDKFIEELLDLDCQVKFSGGFDTNKRISVSWIDSAGQLKQCQYEYTQEMILSGGISIYPEILHRLILEVKHQMNLI